MQYKKLPFYFSIDFEDFYYDSLRALNIPNPQSKEKAMFVSYDRITEISKKYFQNRKMTFFVTGILAAKMPLLIKKIHSDGHEIACHYNYHDDINKSDREEFSTNLDIAIERIQDATGQKPLGFRAPNFAIDPENVWAYEELSKRFLYDSSYKTSKDIANLKNQKYFTFNNHRLEEFFIFGSSTIIKNFNIRSGGTFMRLFPVRLTLRTMYEANKLGHIPLIYMHPYELTLNHDFWMTWKDLNNLNLLKRIYTWTRQLQWSHLGHKSVDQKLSHICQYFEHQGPMKSLIKDKNA